MGLNEATISLADVAGGRYILNIIVLHWHYMVDVFVCGSGTAS